MASHLLDAMPRVDRADLDKARNMVEQIFLEEARFPGSPLNPGMVKLNLDHTDRVRANAVAIAEGEGLNIAIMELAAILHDVAKIDHRESASGGVDTWHHHHRGASLARKIILADLPSALAVADVVSQMIESHSDIPFIRRYWSGRYHASLPSPESKEEYALRDADVIDMLWVAGMAKIVYIRQVPGSDFYREDGGDIQRAIASAQNSFRESLGCLVTATSKRLAKARVAVVKEFFGRVAPVRTLEDFILEYDYFIASVPDRQI